MIVQVSRWDVMKDMTGVMQAFADHIIDGRDIELARLHVDLDDAEGHRLVDGEVDVAEPAEAARGGEPDGLSAGPELEVERPGRERLEVSLGLVELELGGDGIVGRRQFGLDDRPDIRS